MCLKNSLSILIVGYNIELDSSITVKSLYECYELLPKNTSITFWNNGPDILENKNFNIFKKNIMEVVETPKNIPLSIIYNKFLNEFDSERYLILDHDTEVNEQFILDVLSTSFNISVPTIKNNGYISSPGFYNGSNIFMAIGSGICLLNQVKSDFALHYGTLFDERFVLYGVDTTFFLRANNIYQSSDFGVLSEVRHSLSKHEIETGRQKEFRRIERAYDLSLTFCFYLSFDVAIVTMKKFLVNVIRIRNEINIIHFFRGLITKKHYRV